MGEVRRKDREISKEMAYEILKNAEYAVLATINVNGDEPYCIPFSPVLVDDTIYFHCAPEGQKLNNIRKNPNVCVTCIGNTELIPENYTTAYESAVVTGIASEVEEDKEKIFALKEVCLKFAPSNMENFEKAIKASLHRTTVCKIKINSITGKAKRKVKG